MSVFRTRRVAPRWLLRATKDKPELCVFLDNQKFYDDIHGRLNLTQLERDLVDTPEFQRLFRISQLGFVDLVFQSANHTRGAHSVASCAVAKHLVSVINENSVRVAAERAKPLKKRKGAEKDDPETPYLISFSSSVLISLGALLHDISHGPFSHDIEKKKHKLYPRGEREAAVRSYYGPYAKHDDYDNHAGLFLALMVPERSVLASALRVYSPAFWELVQVEAGEMKDPELDGFVQLARKEWPGVKQEILPSLLFHLLVFEKPKKAKSSLPLATSFLGDKTEWGLGPRTSWDKLHKAWYQPYRHDIIGNTISTDLLDYLLRDMRRLGISRQADLHFLDFYVLAASEQGYRCAVDLNDYKRGTVRFDVVNEIFRLLDLRFEIHEKAVFHRVVQAASAMLSRSLLLLGNKKPNLGDLYGFGDKHISPALCGEDLFLQQLIDVSKPPEPQSIAQKLAERRVYRPLMVIPGDRVMTLFRGEEFDPSRPESYLRPLAAIVDSSYYAPFFCFMSWCIENFLGHAYDDIGELRKHVNEVRQKGGNQAHLAMRRIPKRVIFWTLPYKQLHKDPTVWVRARTPGHKDVLCPLEEIAAKDLESGEDKRWYSLARRIRAGIEDADAKYESLWKLFVFLSDGLFYTGVLAKFIGDHPCAKSPDESLHSHREHLLAAQGLGVETLRSAWYHWKTHDEHVPLEGNCPEDQFLLLLGRVADPQAEEELALKLAPEISAVAVDQYLHAEPPPGALVGAPALCRDARYKFGRLIRKTGIPKFLEQADVSTPAREWLGELFAYVKCDSWSEDELEELVERLRLVPETIGSVRPNSIAARGGDYWPSLKALWRGDSDWQDKWKRSG